MQVPPLLKQQTCTSVPQFGSLCHPRLAKKHLLRTASLRQEKSHCWLFLLKSRDDGVCDVKNHYYLTFIGGRMLERCRAR